MAIEFVGASSARSANGALTATVPRPAKVVAGDVLIAISAGLASSVVPSIPAGWSLRLATTWGSANNIPIHIFWRIVAEGEPSSYTFSRTGTIAYLVVGIAAYRGVEAPDVFDIPTDSEVLASSSPVTVPGVTTTSDGAMSVAMTFNAGEVDSLDGLMTNRDTGDLLPGFHDGVITIAGATGDRTFSSSSPSGKRFILTALRPDPDYVPPVPTAKPWTEAFVVE